MNKRSGNPDGDVGTSSEGVGARILPFRTPKSNAAMPDFAARNAVTLEDEDD